MTEYNPGAEMLKAQDKIKRVRITIRALEDKILGLTMRAEIHRQNMYGYSLPNRETCVTKEE